MKLMVDTGRWRVISDDARVHLEIRPRRSPLGDATRVFIRAEPMPLRVFEPESLGSQRAPAAAWVWDGTVEQAKALTLDLLDALRTHFQSEPADTAAGRWRSQVVSSLFPPRPDDTTSASRRA